MRKKASLTITEHLEIKNFFSIMFLDWEIKEFNVLTGGIAAGKSLCIKLVYFFEGILDEVITFSNRDTFTKAAFYDAIEKAFNEIFHNKPKRDYLHTEISYEFIVNKCKFDLTVKWDAENKKLKWESKYINSHIKKWHDKSIRQNNHI